MAKLDELYQEILMDHVNRPRCRAELAPAEVAAEAYNPLCGDRVQLAVDLRDDVVSRIRFDGEGCAICMASASIAAEQGTGVPRGELDDLCELILRAVNDQGELPDDAPAELAAIVGVRRFPMRTKCAMLPWQALKQALATCDATNNATN